MGAKESGSGFWWACQIKAISPSQEGQADLVSVAHPEPGDVSAGSPRDGEDGLGQDGDLAQRGSAREDEEPELIVAEKEEILASKGPEVVRAPGVPTQAERDTDEATSVS